ncbi:hypothetical protein K439DRAFT_779371 [Ramaria rubella]|nr:hypothetical protein K439DRAFT_779371 [Ramaria rubella]
MSENDVEMSVVADSASLEKPGRSSLHPPPESPTASSASFRRSHSPSTPLELDNPESHQDAAVELANSRTPKAESKSRSASAQAPPSDNVISIPPASAQPEASTSAIPPPSHPKPKSTKQRKSRSPSPQPPAPPPPPLLTVRLDIALGGPDHYEVDISGLAMQTGQRNPTPPPIKRDTSDSEGEDSDDGLKSRIKSKLNKRSRAAEYDLNDPFIDDSELAIDDRTHFAQTKQQGFYVSSGEVALLKDKNSPKKPRSKRPLILTSAAAASIQPLSTAAPPSLAPSAHVPPPPQEGTRESPIALLDDDDKPPLKRKLSPGHSAATSAANESADGPKKRRKVQQLQPFHPDLEASIETMKLAIAAESFEVKGKFPPALKPKLQQLALQAIVLDEYNENFFARMPQLFPYNKFTMTKLIKRLVYAEHHQLLTARQDELLVELKDLAEKGFEQAIAEWERNVSNWRERCGRYEADLLAGGQLKGQSVSAEPSANGDENGESPVPNTEGSVSGSGSSKDKLKEFKELQEKEPPKKYRLTEPMKSIFWQLYCLSNECSRLTNEKNQLEGIPDSVSEQGMRKGLYQKIIAVFPEGWMTSGNISRDISVIKKKHELDQHRLDEMP